jgi:hypothetical protein
MTSRRRAYQSVVVSRCSWLKTQIERINRILLLGQKDKAVCHTPFRRRERGYELESQIGPPWPYRRLACFAHQLLEYRL